MKLLLGCGVEVESRSRSPPDTVVKEAVIPEMVVPVSYGNVEDEPTKQLMQVVEQGGRIAVLLQGGGNVKVTR